MHSNIIGVCTFHICEAYNHITSLGAVYRKESKFGTEYMVLVSNLKVRKLHVY